MAVASGPRSWPKSNAESRSGRPAISDAPGDRYARIARFLSFLFAPTIGYAVSRSVDAWSHHQSWAESMPWLRYGLGMAALALGGVAGYWGLRGLFRLLRPLFPR